MKLISWNVNGLRACLGKGFLDFFNAENADVFCLQETKMQPGQADLDLPGYEQYWRPTASGFPSRTARAAPSPSNSRTSTSSPSTPPTPSGS